MDLRLAVSASTDDNVPPIPTRRHSHIVQQSDHQRELRDARDPRDQQSRGSRRSSPLRMKHTNIPPASPEVISSLITSLSIISQPANTHFESHPPALNFTLPAGPAPDTPSTGSFGVDYGAYTRSEPEDASRDPASLDDLAASPPIIRTSKPTSGYSPLATPKSSQSKTRSSSRESASGLRSFIRSASITSRPSSPGSVTSKNDDSRSVGNLSVERGSAPTPELKHHRSHDSWSKRVGRNTKGLMYMSSKERLRERSFERNRLAGGSSNVGGATGGEDFGNTHNGCRPDPSLAETTITEEPASNGDTTQEPKNLKESEPNTSEPKALSSRPQPIPTRDSSLRQQRSQQQKRSSARRPKRESDIAIADAILETEELARDCVLPIQQHPPAAPERESRVTSFLLGPDEHSTAVLSEAKVTKIVDESNMTTLDYHDDDDDEGAPFPSVSQRRGDDRSTDRSNRIPSGHHSRSTTEASTGKKSNSGLRHPSAPLSPPNGRNSSRPRNVATPDSSRRQSVYPVGYERPDSADSVDDAVESYLCSPRLSQKIRHPQTGRVISFSEVGDANGSAVFCCVGMGLTRYITAFYDELALTLRLRLITPDRPGVGDSEPYEDGTTTPLSWPDDVYAICHALKITKFSILAHSAGAIYALATALRMPQHIRGRIHLLAPWIPPSQMNVFGGSQNLPPTNAIPTSQKILRHLPTTFLKAANSSFMTATSSSITSSLPKNPRRSKRKSNSSKDASNTNNRDITPTQDRGVFANATRNGDRMKPRSDESSHEIPRISESMDVIQPVGSNGINGNSTAADPTAYTRTEKERQVTYDKRLTHAIWELATTGANPAVDLLTCLERRHTIGFRYVDITRPVVIHHGSRDTRVPVDNVKWLGKTMRRCEVRVLEGEGHGLMASATVMGSVLMEMSKEWEDWMRVTGADGRKDRERGRRGTLGRS